MTTETPPTAGKRGPTTEAKKELRAFEKCYEALKSVRPEERMRVINSALALLGHPEKL
jgi:hypothetical protein